MFYKEWLAKSDLLMGPVIALVIFFAVFVIVLFRVLRGMRSGKKLDRLASLPLADDETPRGNDHSKGAA